MAATAFDAWIFDLDNTLYPASVDLFSQIDRRMKAYIARTLHICPEEAFRLQKEYYHRYGTSLRGLMQEHGIDPSAFLADVHDIDHSVLSPDLALDRTLSRLPGRKIVFTNGSQVHAERVLDRLGVTRHFSAIHDIIAAGYVPKPQMPTYEILLDVHGIDPTRAIMFEDMEKNLAPAAALGMTTVWVRNTSHWSSFEKSASTDTRHCHHVTDNLVNWLETWLSTPTTAGETDAAPASSTTPAPTRTA